MARWGNCDMRQLQKLQQTLAKLQEADLDHFCREVSKELAARLLALVIPETPVGKYPKGTGKTGGTLRRGWTAGSSSAQAYAQALPIQKQGGAYTVEVINPIPYASYVEFGHRTGGGRGWVEGKYFLTLSEQKLQGMIPGLVEKKLEQRLREVFYV